MLRTKAILTLAGATLLGACGSTSSTTAAHLPTTGSTSSTTAASKLATPELGSPVTITDPAGFKFRVQASKPTLSATRPAAGILETHRQIAPPGQDWVKIDVKLTNLQTNRPATVTNSAFNWGLAMPPKNVNFNAYCGVGAPVGKTLCLVSFPQVGGVNSVSMFNSKGEYLASSTVTVHPLALTLGAGKSELVTIYFRPCGSNGKKFPSTVSFSGMRLIEYGPITTGANGNTDYGSVYKIPLG